MVPGVTSVAASRMLPLQGGGLGLGLSLVRQIVELHGGTVGVESGGKTKGSTFWVSLPALPGLDRRPAAQLPAPVPVTLTGLSISTD